jgi:hypothetical protein
MKIPLGTETARRRCFPGEALLQQSCLPHLMAPLGPVLAILKDRRSAASSPVAATAI